MRSSMKSLQVLFILSLLARCCLSNLSMDPNFYHTSVSTDSSANVLFTVQINTNINAGSVHAFLLNTLGRFSIDPMTLNVTATTTLSPGKYDFDIVVFVESRQLYGVAVVDVTSRVGEACADMAFGNCSHYCREDITAPYSYSCYCHKGYVLQLDGYSCLAFDPLPRLLVSSSEGLQMFTPLTNHFSSLLLSQNVDTFDFFNELLYYVDNEANTIAKRNLYTAEEEIVYGLTTERVSGLAVNWENGNVLYSDSENGTIVELDTTTKAISITVSSLMNPRDIVLYSSTAMYMVWIEGQLDSSSIVTCYTNCSERFLVKENISHLVSISIDSVTGQIYWVTTSSLQSVPFVGGTTSTLYTFENEIPSGIAVFEVFAYVILPLNNSIVRLTTHNFNGLAVYYSTDLDVNKLTVFHPLKKPTSKEGVNSCSECEDTCVLASDRITCNCGSGFMLSSDGHSCLPDEVSEFIFSMSIQHDGKSLGTVVSASIDGVWTQRLVDSSSGISLGQMPTGIIYSTEYDLETGVLYYGDRTDHSIWRVSLRRLTQKQDDRTQIVYNTTVRDMTYDWLRKILYWSDDSNNVISYIDVTNNEAKKMNLYTSVCNLTGIAVDPYEQWLYWLDTCLTPKLSRFKTDGSAMDSEVLLNDGIIAPSGLVIDFRLRKIYWGDIGKVEQSNLDGTERIVLYSNDQISPFDMDIVRDNIVFTSGNSYVLVNIHNTTNVAQLTLKPSAIFGELPLYAVSVPSSYRRFSEGQYMCVRNVVGCSQDCIASDSGAVSCACLQGYSLRSDGITCEYNGECPVCHNGGVCYMQGLSNSVNCTCQSGYFGTSCDQRCNCLNGGQCNNSSMNECTCPSGYTGKLCEQEITICSPNPCQNGGECRVSATTSNSSVECICMEGFSGEYCNNIIHVNLCDPNPCDNGGNCSDSVDGYTCVCAAGFTGTNCSNEVNECNSNQCVNGTCIDEVNSFSCTCNEGYTGVFCDIDINECAVADVCLNNSECENLPGTFECSCISGYFGANCDNECPEGTYGKDCANSCICFNNATCDKTNGSCICPEGYSGLQCDNFECSEPCNNGGICIDVNTCMCPETYGGTTCSTRICTADICQNGGTCFVFEEDLSCRCPSFTSGPQCQFDDSIFNPQTGNNISTGVSVGVSLSIFFIVLLLAGLGALFYYTKCGHSTITSWLNRIKGQNKQKESSDSPFTLEAQESNNLEDILYEHEYQSYREETPER